MPVKLMVELGRGDEVAAAAEFDHSHVEFVDSGPGYLQRRLVAAWAVAVPRRFQ